MGVLHVVRRIDFQNGDRWLARVQLKPATPESSQLLLNEIDTIGVGAAFMLMEFVPGDTAMDSSGGYATHKGEIPAQFRDKFNAALAEIQLEMASIRFHKIGAIVIRDGGEFDVGPIPGLRGPFNTAAEYFEAWAKTAKFYYKEATVRKRTPADLVDEVLAAIWSFPCKVGELGGRFQFRNGPFPLIHTDLYSSNVIIDIDCNVLSVID
ncbi:hypothetical protein N658DRAFT_503104 [Parathielavia hyrcaniae]|uniref:Aminoglycoside phosphotransferase domain-containing protein n=1 Tax=Parathielavia hyrcaniae TaxID=113614 RepID=A0AAN6QAP0_9PEZI|nr:hypothetical protein N658DRAFT_503104 [Parathielavia hyrcaniae]